jgi:hypothetical protein
MTGEYACLTPEITESDEKVLPAVAALDGRTTFAWFGRYLAKDFGLPSPGI